MILRSSPASPFGRKCKMSASILGLMDQIQVTNSDVTDPEDSIRQENPLGKIPALILENDTCLFDSRVICEYLDNLAGGGRLFPTGANRWDVLAFQALSDGLIDASILQVYEKRFRPEEKRHQDWVNYQQAKVVRGLAYLETNIPNEGETPNIGDVTLACALGYLDFRFEGVWRDRSPNLVAWLGRFAEAVPAFEDTAPSG